MMPTLSRRILLTRFSLLFHGQSAPSVGGNWSCAKTREVTTIGNYYCCHRPLKVMLIYVTRTLEFPWNWNRYFSQEAVLWVDYLGFFPGTPSCFSFLFLWTQKSFKAIIIWRMCLCAECVSSLIWILSQTAPSQVLSRSENQVFCHLRNWKMLRITVKCPVQHFYCCF